MTRQEEIVLDGYRAGEAVDVIAERLGCGWRRTCQIATGLRRRGVEIPNRKGYRAVPAAPFRERYAQIKAFGVTDAELARRVGWPSRRGHNVARIAKQESLTVPIALKLAEALGLEPWEVGL